MHTKYRFVILEYSNLDSVVHVATVRLIASGVPVFETELPMDTTTYNTWNLYSCTYWLNFGLCVYVSLLVIVALLDIL